LAGSEIDIKARILAVADVYDAMTNPRPYRSSVDPHEVIEMIRQQAGTQFDPHVVDAFLRAIDSPEGIDHLVMLKTDHSIFAPNHSAKWWADEPQPTGNKT
jgi:HD-GYP domain-containing protein (c-di-GMP phosphodiesterase class II)